MKLQIMTEKGFSLIEVLVASLLLGIAILGLAVVVPANNRQVTNTSSISEGSAFAQQYVESLRSLWSGAANYVNNTNLAGFGAFNATAVTDGVHSATLHPGQIFYYNPKYVFYVQIWDPKSAMPQAAPPGATLTKRIRVTFYLGNGNAAAPAIKAGAANPVASFTTDISSTPD